LFDNFCSPQDQRVILENAITNKKCQKRVDWVSPRMFLRPCPIFPGNTKENYGRVRPSENALHYL